MKKNMRLQRVHLWKHLLKHLFSWCDKLAIQVLLLANKMKSKQKNENETENFFKCTEGSYVKFRKILLNVNPATY